MVDVNTIKAKMEQLNNEAQQLNAERQRMLGAKEVAEKKYAQLLEQYNSTYNTNVTDVQQEMQRVLVEAEHAVTNMERQIEYIRSGAYKTETTTSEKEVAPVNLAPVNTTPVNTAPVNVAPVNVAPINVAPVNVAPVNTAPVNTVPVNVAPVNVAPINVTPVNVAPVNTAPVNTASVNTVPVNTASVNTAPVNTAPILDFSQLLNNSTIEVPNVQNTNASVVEVDADTEEIVGTGFSPNVWGAGASVNSAPEVNVSSASEVNVSSAQEVNNAFAGLFNGAAFNPMNLGG